MSISQLVTLRANLLRDANDVPDELCDSATALCERAEHRVMNTPIRSEADAAAKLRLLADLIDNKAGTHCKEGDYLRHTAEEISAWRLKQYADDFGGRQHPQYDA